MATKAQLINFIMEKFVNADGSEIQKSKLDSYKKADLEGRIKARGMEEDLKTWLVN